MAGVYQVGVHLIGQSDGRAQIGIYKNDNLIMEIVDVDPPTSVMPDMGSTIKMELVVNDTLKLKQVENNPSEVMFSGLLIKSGIDYRIQKITNSGTTYTDLVTSSDKPTTSIVESLNQNDLIRVILAKNFSDKQIEVSKKNVEYILKNIERSYEKINTFSNSIDSLSLTKAQPIKLHLIKKVLNEISVQ